VTWGDFEKDGIKLYDMLQVKSAVLNFCNWVLCRFLCSFSINNGKKKRLVLELLNSGMIFCQEYATIMRIRWLITIEWDSLSH
jgi:hypothetical protein